MGSRLGVFWRLVRRFPIAAVPIVRGDCVDREKGRGRDDRFERVLGGGGLTGRFYERYCSD